VSNVLCRIFYGVSRFENEPHVLFVIFSIQTLYWLFYTSLLLDVVGTFFISIYIPFHYKVILECMFTEEARGETGSLLKHP